MGGSSIGGALAREVLGDRASRPILLARDYALPAWTTPDTTVLCSSYSGETEETLAIYEAAGALGARRVVATTGGKLAAAARADSVPVIPLPGGFQPRVAVAYLLVIALEVAGLCGAGDRLHSEIDVAAAHAEALVRKWGPDGPDDALPKELARGLYGTVPQIAGAGLTAPIAYRWKMPDQRERQGAVLLWRVARARPQRDRRMGRSQGTRTVQRCVPRRLRPASAHQTADRVDPRD